MCNVISLADRRNEKAKRQRGDELRKLCNQLRWFLDSDIAGITLAKEKLRTAAALDIIVAQIEDEAARDILRTRRLSFGFIDVPAPVVSKPSAAISKRADVKITGSLVGRIVFSGEMLCSG
jgi:hypothetical protein